MSASHQLYRVRFSEWNVYAMDVAAPDPQSAVWDAQDILKMQGHSAFALVSEDARAWEVEQAFRQENALSALRKAHTALNAAPRFQVGDEDSYVIAAELARAIREMETGGAS